MNARALVLGIIAVMGITLVVVSQQGKTRSTRKAVVGLDAPEFVLQDAEGGELRLSSLKGKTVFVHFWASWCKECREEMPRIQALHDRKKADPSFVFISVIYNEDPAVSRAWLKENGYAFPVYVDPDGSAARDYGLTGVPETFIIDEGGVLRQRVLGPANWDRIS